MKFFMKGFVSLVFLEMIKIFDENELEVGKINKLIYIVLFEYKQFLVKYIGKVNCFLYFDS